VSEPAATTANAGAAGPLAGVGVLVTRPVRQSATFAERIAVLGAEPFILPALEIAPPSDDGALARALQRLSAFDLAFFVSANAAEAVVVREPHWPRTLTALAVGPTTADALISGGIDNVLVPEERHDSEGVLALPSLQDVRGKRVLVFRGESDREGGGGRELFRTTLEARGAIVEPIACYRRAKPSLDPSPVLDAWRTGRIHAVIATSVEVLDNFIDLIGVAGRTMLAATPLFVPHPRIASHAMTRSLSRVIVTGATDAGLIAGLLNHFTINRPTT
jgi:uroporphyrinogen-III synthase